MIAPTSTARAPFPWFGGKQKLADSIIATFPPHNTYVEVFAGGASVLLSKSPALLEVYNDVDDGLVNFFRMLRDRPEELVAMLELTPYARSEWESARATWQNEDDELERARLFYVVAAGSFAGFAAADAGKSGRGWGGEKLGRMHLSRSASTANRVDHIWRFVERFRRVQIDNLDWRACLTKYDHPDAVLYLDPPYVPATRRSGGYIHELTVEDHEELVARVLELQGCAVVSGYDHAVYRPLTEKLTKHEFKVLSTAAVRRRDTARDHRVECLWVSEHGAIPTLFTHEERPAFRPVPL